MKSPVIYFDTSVFIGLIDNIQDRQKIARNIVRYEASLGSEIHTSIMTINEFIGKTYDNFHDHPDCENEVKKAVNSIRDIATIYAFNDEVARESARLLSVWGRVRMLNGAPRDKKFRWDSIHLATANLLKADRVYTWDEDWNDFPKTEIPFIKELIAPAFAPATYEQSTLFSNTDRELDIK